MARVKDFYADEIEAAARESEERGEPDSPLGGCANCTFEGAVEDGLCRSCWNEANGQFGVGA